MKVFFKRFVPTCMHFLPIKILNEMWKELGARNVLSNLSFEIILL